MSATASPGNPVRMSTSPSSSCPSSCSSSMKTKTLQRIFLTLSGHPQLTTPAQRRHGEDGFPLLEVRSRSQAEEGVVVVVVVAGHGGEAGGGGVVVVVSVGVVAGGGGGVDEEVVLAVLPHLTEGKAFGPVC